MGEPTSSAPAPGEASRQPDWDRAATLYVANLPYEERESEISELFAKYGEVLHVSPQTRRDRSNSFNGTAFVVMQNKDEAEVAVRELHDSVYKNNKIRVEWGRTNYNPEYSRSRSTYRSPYPPSRSSGPPPPMYPERRRDWDDDRYSRSRYSGPRYRDDDRYDRRYDDDSRRDSRRERSPPRYEDSDHESRYVERRRRYDDYDRDRSYEHDSRRYSDRRESRYDDSDRPRYREYVRHDDYDRDHSDRRERDRYDGKDWDNKSGRYMDRDRSPPRYSSRYSEERDQY